MKGCTWIQGNVSASYWVCREVLMCRAAPPLTQYRPRPRTTQTTVTSLPGQTGCWAGGKGATCLRGSRRALPCVAVTSSALPSPAAPSSPSQPGASPRSLRPAAGRRTLLCYVHPSAPMSALRSDGGGSESVSHSVVSDSATAWTVAHQAALSMGFSRQEYWSG